VIKVSFKVHVVRRGAAEEQPFSGPSVRRRGDKRRLDKR
jgi:hypothetical protein